MVSLTLNLALGPFNIGDEVCINTSLHSPHICDIQAPLDCCQSSVWACTVILVSSHNRISGMCKELDEGSHSKSSDLDKKNVYIYICLAIITWLLMSEGLWPSWNNFVWCNSNKNLLKFRFICFMQTDYERYTCKEATYTLPNTKHSLPNME